MNSCSLTSICAIFRLRTSTDLPMTSAMTSQTSRNDVITRVAMRRATPHPPVRARMRRARDISGHPPTGRAGGTSAVVSLTLHLVFCGGVVR